QSSMLCEPRHARKPAALLVDCTADLDGSLELDSRAADCLHRVDRCGDSRFHVAGAATVDAPVSYFAAERIHRPAGPGGHDIEVAVQVDERTQRTPAEESDDIDA